MAPSINQSLSFTLPSHQLLSDVDERDRWQTLREHVSLLVLALDLEQDILCAVVLNCTHQMLHAGAPYHCTQWPRNG